MKKGVQTLLISGIACAVLGAIFVAYTRPDFLVMLSNQLWACF